jgi:hypothetical protein
MITRIYEGISQTQHVVTAHRHHPLSAVPGQIRLAYATQDQMGVDVGGGIGPTPPRFLLLNADACLELQA